MKFKFTPLIVSVAACWLATGCLTTRSQLREQNDDDSAKSAQQATPQPAKVQDVQPAGNYALDEIKGEMTRIQGRVEDLERTQKQSNSDQAIATTKEEIKKLDGRILELEQAQQQMLEAIKKIQETPAAPPVAADPAEMFETGKDNFGASNYEMAIENFNSYLKSPKAKHAEDATFLRAESHFALKQYKKAIVDYSKFPEKYTKSKFMPGALYKIGLCFDALGMKDDARGFYQELEEKFPKSAEAHKIRKQLK